MCHHRLYNSMGILFCFLEIHFLSRESLFCLLELMITRVDRVWRWHVTSWRSYALQGLRKSVEICQWTKMGRWNRMYWIFGASTVLLLLVRFTKWNAISISNEVDERYERIKRQHPQFPLLDEKRLPDASLKTILLWNSVLDSNFSNI
jgi:hypothetical protein